MFKKYKNKIIGFIIGVVIGVFISVLIYIFNFKQSQNKSDNEIWKSINEFSNDIIITKNGNIVSESDILIVSDIDGTVNNINIEEGNIVAKGQILMKIKNSSSNYIDELQNDEIILSDLQNQYENIENHYKKTDLDYSVLINNLEQEFLNVEKNLSLIITKGNAEEQIKMEKELEYLENQISSLQLMQQSIHNEDNMKMIELKNEIQSIRNEYNMYYNEMNDIFSKSTVNGTISKVFVENGDKVHEGDVLCSIENDKINNISVDLDFNEYLLVKDISNVGLEFDIGGNILSYSGNIFSRSPVADSNGKYSVVIEVNYDENDENLKKIIKENGIEKIWVKFSIKSDGIWLSEDCFSNIGNSTGTIIYRNENTLLQSDLSIDNRQNGLILVKNLSNLIESSIRKLRGKIGLKFNKIEHVFENDKFIANNFGKNINDVEILCI